MSDPRKYLPAAGLDWLLPLYDPWSRLLGADAARKVLLDQANLQAGPSALDKSGRWILLTAALVLLLFLHQPMFLLVAGGFVYRLFTKDLPPQPSRFITAYFIVVLAALGVLISLLPPAAANAP